MTPVFSSQVSVGTVPSLVVTEQAMSQVAYLYNAQKSENQDIFVGGSADVTITTGHHLAHNSDLAVTLGPQDQLWAVSDENGRTLTVLNVRQD
jgi:hypothetical protein